MSNVDENVQICEKHRQDFTYAYQSSVNVCSNPGHSGGTRYLLDKQKREVNFNLSYDCLHYIDISVPYGTMVCILCARTLQEEVNRAKAMEPMDESSPSMFSEASSFKPSQGSEYLPTPEQPTSMTALNDFLAISSEKLRLKSQLVLPFEQVDEHEHFRRPWTHLFKLQRRKSMIP